VVKVRNGRLEARQPGSDDYQQSLAFELASGSVLNLGSYFEDPQQRSTYVVGRMQVTNSTLSASGTHFDGFINSELSKLRVQRSTLTNSMAPDQTVVNVSLNSGMDLLESQLSGDHLNVGDASLLMCRNSTLAAAEVRVNNSSFNTYECSGSGPLNLVAARARLDRAIFPQSVLYATTQSVAEVINSHVALVHIESASTVMISDSTVSGLGQTPWGDGTMRVGTLSLLSL
jgi:hypothetical protein